MASTDALGGVTRYSYNGRSQLSGVNNARGVDAFSFVSNLLDQLTQTTDVDDTTTADYDAADRLQSVTQPDGSKVQYALDAAGRRTQVEYSDATRVSYVYDRAGRVTQMVDDIGTTTYGYDESNRLLFVNAYGKTVSYSYDDDGLVVARTDSDGVTTTFTYDDAGRLASATRAGHSISYGYDAAGRLTQKSMSNGLMCTFSYDDASRLVSLQWTNGRQPLFSNSYTYDAASNRLTNVETREGRVRRWAYEYDALNRLTRATLNQHLQTTYEYDAVGNLLRRTTRRLDGGDRDEDYDAEGVEAASLEHLGADTAFTCNVKDQVVAAGNTVCTWDPNGNLTGQRGDNSTMERASSSTTAVMPALSARRIARAT